MALRCAVSTLLLTTTLAREAEATPKYQERLRQCLFARPLMDLFRSGQWGNASKTLQNKGIILVREYHRADHRNGKGIPRVETILNANDLRTDEQRTAAWLAEQRALAEMYFEHRGGVHDRRQGKQRKGAHKEPEMDAVLAFHQRHVDGFFGVLMRDEANRSMRDSQLVGGLKQYRQGIFGRQAVDDALKRLESLGIWTVGDLMQQSLISLHRLGFSKEMLGIITRALRDIGQGFEIGLEPQHPMSYGGRRLSLPRGIGRRTGIGDVADVIEAVEAVPSVGPGNGSDFMRRLGLDQVVDLAEAHTRGTLPRSGITLEEYQAIVRGAERAGFGVIYHD